MGGQGGVFDPDPPLDRPLSWAPSRAYHKYDICISQPIVNGNDQLTYL